MTCIAIIKNKKNKLMMAGDRRSSSGWDQAQSMPVPKIMKDELGFLRGATGDGHLCEILVEVFKMPESRTSDLKLYMHYTVREKLIKFLIQQNYRKGQELYFEADEYCELILGIEGTVWSITLHPYGNEKGQVKIMQIDAPYATGCGGLWAWGAGEVLQSDDIRIYDPVKDKFKKLTEKEILVRMMNTAAKYSPGVDNEIDFIIED